MVRTVIVALIVSALLGCAGAGQPAAQSAAATIESLAPAHTLLAQLPTPGVFRSANYVPADLVRRGADYLAEPRNRVVTEGAGGVTGVFTPNYQPGVGTELADAAYALYAFNLEDYELGAEFTLELDQSGASGDLWLGLADWGSDHWRWYPAHNGSVLSLNAAQFAPYLQPGNSQCLAAVVALGDAPWVLNTISISEVLPPVYPNQDAVLGMNLAGVPDWGRAWMFVDVFKHARGWISQPSDNSSWDDGRPISTDADGWVTSLLPGQVAGNVLLTGQLGNYPSGEYICLYDGEGSLNFRLNGSIVSQEPGRIVVAVDASNDGLVHLQITSTNQANPLRNIRLIMPGFEATYESQLFHPTFLASIEPYGVLRLMDLMETNGSNQQAWVDRPTPQKHSQAAHGGVCVEYLTALANRAGADPWFCMPHLATDNYVRQFATYVRDNLNSDLRVYVEHSNEVWNGIFEQADYARQQGMLLGLSENEYQAQLYYHARRSVEMFTIWEEVFGGSERLVRVLASQHANPWTAEQVLGFEDAGLHADALATAPYFGGYLGSPDTQDTVAAMSIADILQACDEDSLGNAATTATNKTHADSYGLELISYEGGQHLVGHGGAENNTTMMDLFQATNRYPGMRQAYTNDLTRWEGAGGGLFCAFSHISAYSKWGSWGVMELQEQELANSPKLQGLLDYKATFE